MEALKALAGANLEAALYAAARIGALKSADAAKPIKRAIDMLEYGAEGLKAAYAPYGFWDGEEASKKDFDEMKSVAKQLRELIAA